MNEKQKGCLRSCRSREWTLWHGHRHREIPRQGGDTDQQKPLSTFQSWCTCSGRRTMLGDKVSSSSCRESASIPWGDLVQRTSVRQDCCCPVDYYFREVVGLDGGIRLRCFGTRWRLGLVQGCLLFPLTSVAGCCCCC